MDVSGTDFLVRIAGSAALLLWGARMTRTGMMRAFGEDIQRTLVSGTKNRFFAMIVGVIAATVLQSSTAVAMLAASFASTGTILAAGGLAMMLGADLGSAIAAQILSLNIQDIWPMLMFSGYVLYTFFDDRNTQGKQLGRVLMGLACIFLALKTLGQTAGLVGESNLVHDILSSLGQEPILAIIITALLTWLAHSSLATLLLITVLAGTQVLPEGDLAYIMVLGVNAGAALPAFIMGLGEKPVSRRILLGNLLFRIFGVFLALLLMDLWLPFIEQLDTTIGQKLIYTHIGFNIALIFILIPTTGLMAKWLERIIPDVLAPASEWQPRHLDPSAIEMPPLALTSASRETLRMVDLVEIMIDQSFQSLDRRDDKLMEETREMDDAVDTLYYEIKLYLTDLTRQELDEAESSRAFEILSFATNLESIGDIVDRSLLDTIANTSKTDGKFSDEGYAELVSAFEYVKETSRLSAKVFMEQDISDARDLLSRKENFRNLESQSMDSHLDRLRGRQANSIATTGFHIDILRDLRRMNSHFASVAYPMLDAKGHLRKTRLTKKSRS